jgi:cellulose synthase/poly-beta-1,6-N-acetylglucosamine synthase-like glycosyltransferase
MIETAVIALLWLVVIPLTAAALYLGVLGLLALLPQSRTAHGPPTRRFLLLIPAHDEAARLPHLLASIDRLDYPHQLVSVAVVADNCTDDTARLAGEAGAQVIEREDVSHVGKGHAIAFGLEAVAGVPYDALVLVDADCTVSPSVLRAFDAELERGAEAVQGYYTMTSHSESPTGLLRQYALALVHLVRARAKRWYSGSAGLKGSGMCFARPLIEQLGWHSTGLAEDAEQHVALLRSGARVEFAQAALITGDAPSTLSEARIQHERWEAGRSSAARSGVLPLVWLGIRRRCITLLDAAVELAIPPLSILVLGLTASLTAAWFVGDTAMLRAAAAGLLAIVVYMLSGVLLTRPRPRELLSALIAMPVYVGWKAQLYLKSLISRPAQWQRTRRDARS